ncbi:hypothetical protein DYB25_007422 [Aphanomyces astaci]|uniref:SMP-30/Gluconolactonase/LRE-like region domain-containing protein n=2 Tax=Aphanomyces astaci TaxID=112090 RepID=A0A397FVR6_APHAT|nr:hypothetical protein DYB25_007422 [Aphanomyces astaci]RHY53407.1 hypothetical protein DYB30_009500 [Aphanomyces astaci]RHZ38178.1 hypothetical protein DYB31_005804 [Aphanomyces astaci]
MKLFLACLSMLLNAGHPTSITVSTLAGGTGEGRSYKDGTGAAATFAYPLDLLVTPDGNILVTDPFASVVRQVSASGVVTTIAYPGIGTAPVGICRDDQSGALFVVDKAGPVYRFTPSGSVITIDTAIVIAAGRLDSAILCAASSSALFVTLDSGTSIYKLDRATGLLSTLPAKLPSDSNTGGIVLGPHGTLFVAQGNTVQKIAANFSTMQVFAQSTLWGHAKACTLTYDGFNDILYVTDVKNGIFQVDSTGAVTPWMGQLGSGFVDGDVSVAKFNGPSAIALFRDPQNSTANQFTAYITDSDNYAIRKVVVDTTTLPPTPTPTKSAARPTTFQSYLVALPLIVWMGC